MFYVSWYLFFGKCFIFLTHITQMCNVRNGRYAYGVLMGKEYTSARL